jgi:hypothetical protein
MIQDAATAKAEAKLKARRRVYPKFTDGMTVNHYVHQYYGANAMRWAPVAFRIQGGWYTPDASFESVRKQVVAFFEPLSDRPQFVLWGEEVTCEVEA